MAKRCERCSTFDTLMFPFQGESITHSLFLPKFFQAYLVQYRFWERISSQWEFLCFVKDLMLSQFSMRPICAVSFDKLHSRFSLSKITPLLTSMSGIPDWARLSLCSPPCHHIMLNNSALTQRNPRIKCRGRGYICVMLLMVGIISAAHWVVAVSQDPVRKLKVEAHTILLFPAENVVSSSCAAVLVGWVHCPKSIQECYRQKSTPFKLLWTLGGTANDLARCVTPHTPCWPASRFQLHGCTSHRCSMHVSMSRPWCFCLSAQHRFMISVQDELYIVYSSWL